MAQELVFLIPIVAIVGGIGSGMFKRHLKFRERQMELMGARTAESAAQYAVRTERLEQRVAVLERLLTDRSTHLADEIESLRDKPLN
jgi:cell division protein FtsB